MVAAGVKTNVRSYALCYRAVAAAARAPLTRRQKVRDQLTELVESQVADNVLHNSFSYNALLYEPQPYPNPAPSALSCSHCSLWSFVVLENPT